MYRECQLRGFCLMAFGLGLLVGCCLESGFWCFMLGIGAILFGFIQLQKK